MSSKLQLDVPALLPDVPDERDECIHRLICELEQREGFERTHVLGASGGDPARLCVHYDPELVSQPDIRRTIEGAGTRLTDRYGHALWSIGEAGSEGSGLAERFERMDGVLEAEAISGLLRVEFDREKIREAQLREALEEALGEKEPHEQEQDHEGHDHGHEDHGHGDHDRGHGGHDHHHGGVFGEKTELVFAISSGVVLVIGFLISVFTDVTQWVPLGFYFAAYFFGGFYPLREAVEKVANRKFEIDFLMLVAAAGTTPQGRIACAFKALPHEPMSLVRENGSETDEPHKG